MANLALVWEKTAHGGGCGSRSPQVRSSYRTYLPNEVAPLPPARNKSARTAARGASIPNVGSSAAFLVEPSLFLSSELRASEQSSGLITHYSLCLLIRYNI
jgi:hypothetical protein